MRLKSQNIKKEGMVCNDVGIKVFSSDRKENTGNNLKYLEKEKHKLVKEQRKLSKKETGSNNRKK